MFIRMAEYLSLNGHNRENVYEYSIKKLFYYFEVIEKHKNKEKYDNAINIYNVMLGIHGGEEGSKELKKYLNSIEFR